MSGDRQTPGSGPPSGVVAAPSTFRYWEMIIQVVRGPQKGKELSFTKDVVSVGKAPQNDIALPDETVSRWHLEIRRDARGHLLRDLGSTNGTFLDGAEIREAYLRNGSQVKVGETRFRFRALRRRVRPEPFEGPALEGMVGRGAGMRRAFALACAVAPLDITVQVRGELGTGRRTLARVIHGRSELRSLPFTVVDCSQDAPAHLVERLFEPGSGLLEGEGTVALLEPWELPLEVQARVAEVARRSRRPLRSPSTGPRGQRLLALTSRDLTLEASRGRMDEQLTEALDQVRIYLPPLRDRLEDLPLLVAAVLADLHPGHPGLIARVTSAIETLGGHLSWEGNIISLERLARALALCAETEDDGAMELLFSGSAPFDPALSFGQSKAVWVEGFERRYLRWLLERHRGNVSKAARAADMDRKHLHRLLKRHGLR